MATATTALVRPTGNTGGAMMLMPTGTAIAMGCAGQPPQVSLYPSQQSAYSAYTSQTAIGVSSASGRLLSNNSCDASPASFFPQQPQQSYPLQRSFYQNLTPEPQATTANSVMPQTVNCEAVGSTATMSNDGLTASVLTELGSHSLSVRRPSSCSSRSRPSSSCSSATNVQLPITSTATTATSVAGPVTTNINGLVNSSGTNNTVASVCATKNADILVIRDPFEEEELPGTRCNTTNVRMLLFNQRPPQYINTGNPLDSGGQLELPRHLRVPYPESAYRACIAANKNLATYRNGPPLPSFIPPYPALPGPRPGSVFGPSVPIENSAMYGNPQQQRQQQQLPGSVANFSIVRNNRTQGNASPGCPPLSMGSAPVSVSAQGFGNPYCVQGPAPTQQMLGPHGCMQRTEYLPTPSGPYCMPGGAAGQPYFGGQPIARHEPGTSNMVPLNNDPQVNPMGMVSMSGERVGPVMGVIGVAQHQSVGATAGKKGNNKRSKANKAASAVPNLTITDEQLLASRRKQQSLLPSGQQQQQPMVPGMMLPMSVPSQDFYMSQGICGSRTGVPPHVAPLQQQGMVPMTPANGSAGGGGMGQFDHFDVRPSTSMNCTPMSYCPPIASAPNATDVSSQQQSTSQMIANSMMITRSYGGFEQNGFVDGFQAQRNNGNSGDAVSNNMPANTTVTTSASGDSFTVLNGSTNNQNSNTGNKQRCVSCTEELRSDQPSIQCTANGEGCRRFFHQECSGLLSDAFRAIIAEPCAEWICPDCLCRQQTQLTFA
uniref:PHD-type domain-containing protein n=1 Tax=Elaeophora elaphi TaxID=1147741 RepID=A0A0R3RYZ4_9BILA